MNSPELLLPVGDWSMLKAAVHNGADAVYIGVPGFNARGRSQDFSVEELGSMIEFAHLYNVRVNLAFNVLIFQEELAAAENLLRQLLVLAPDAIIVQDIGLALLIRQLSHEQVIHASTQMTITNADAMSLLDDLNIKRFVLGREVSMDEMQKIKQHHLKELEVFVHGALCVSYSGQCFTSESLGGRSANRGQCAQSCRLPYDVFVDGQKMDMQGRNYVVSPKDLCGLEDVSELMKIGIDSFKIEGRLKSPEYVASCTKSYRQAIDTNKANPKLKEQMASVYSRGFFSGWLHGVDHQQLVDGRFSDHRGLFLGVVKKHDKNQLYLSTNVELHPGDGILLVKNETSVGGPIYAVKQNNNGAHGNTHISMAKSLSIAHDMEGARLYLNGPQHLAHDLQLSWEDRTRQKRLPASFMIQAQPNQFLTITMQVQNQKLSWTSPNEIKTAQKNPANEESLRQELGKLSTTPFILTEFHCQLAQGLFVPNQWVKEARQTLTRDMEQLLKMRTAPTIKISEPLPLTNSVATGSNNHTAVLNILLRKKEQVDQLINVLTNELNHYRQHIGFIYLDFEFGRDFRPSIQLLKQHGLKVGLATNRILKPFEYHHLNSLCLMQPDALLVRNLGALHYLKGLLGKESTILLKGDFSLNVSNHLSAGYLTSKGCDSIAPSLDLNRWQLEKFLHHFSPIKTEMTLHQHLAEFHMEHCVFAAFLSQGSSWRDCGKPCEKHRLELKDPYGETHILQADQECRNTMFRSKAQSAAAMALDWLALGVREFRLEFVDELDNNLKSTIKGYLQLLSQEITPMEFKNHINVKQSYGVTEGQLSVKDSFQNRKQNRAPLA